MSIINCICATVAKCDLGTFVSLHLGVFFYFFCYVCVTIHAFDRQTDGQTDRPAFNAAQQRGKNHKRETLSAANKASRAGNVSARRHVI